MTELEEVEIINDAIRHPGVKLILEKLTKAAAQAQARYDTCQNEKEMIEIQILRRVCLQQIPKIIETIANKDNKGNPKWLFWKWLDNKEA